ncbi:hypothetical protein EVAR_89266_1 [Eumeta japonica]|uniref:Uncharacterized protein n=1 Tax=Eumeta variegata TaxID=151549 RepID=A0A4C1VMC8_EUMVA|nr:hypothetical protein EVAR_89266_1 [Eumeta japonica]
MVASSFGMTGYSATIVSEDKKKINHCRLNEEQMGIRAPKYRWSSQLMDPRNPRGVTSASSASWTEIEYLMERRAD